MFVSFLTVTFSWFIPEHQEGHYILVNLVASYSITRNTLKLTFLRSIYKEITAKNSGSSLLGQMNVLLGTNDVPAPLKTTPCNAVMHLGKFRTPS